MKKIKIYYWSPFISPIATSKAVINSAISLKKFDSKFDCSIFNFFGEFNKYKEEVNFNNINLVDHYKNNIIKRLPDNGKIKSRISFLIIFFMSFFPLKKKIKSNQPDYLIIHLLTSLPLVLLLLYNFETKFILRISGLPKLNFFRKFLWKIALKKIHLITCPTLKTKELIMKQNLVSEQKIKLLYDPILNVRKILKLKKDNFTLPFKGEYFCAIGRLTNQKNFFFLIKAINQLLLRYQDIKLVIVGNGEQEELLRKYILKNKLEKSIFLVGYKKNVFNILKNSRGFILSSLWEDPGFVILEAAFCRTLTLSSNCPNGPLELIKDRKNGFLYISNNFDSFFKKFDEFHSIDEKNKKNILLSNLKNVKKFTIFNHYKSLNSLLSMNE